MHWLSSRELVPTIRALRDQAERYRRHELERAVKLLARGEDPQKILESLTASSGMNKTIAARLTQLGVRLEELDRLLSNLNITADIDGYRKLVRERAEIVPVVGLYQDYRQCEQDIQTAQEMTADPEMRDFADTELCQGKERLAQIEVALQKQLLPKDVNDERNIFLEIRAGTGGDESALFAGDMFRMYTRFAERQRWQVEVISQSPSEIGGYKEIIIKIIGYGAYSRLKFESGGHRVQRVPATETQGRIHTSACTVAVMPEADEVMDVVLSPSDLRIDTFRASGAGPLTYLYLGKEVEPQFHRFDLLSRLLPVYHTILQRLAGLGIDILASGFCLRPTLTQSAIMQHD
ncbi:hypothetical protein B566_EDAN018634 [Ephemera danica]|nr:hypothetical protein B566_EDAN018634 [Ephemera danica]